MLSARVASTDHPQPGDVRGASADRVFAGRAMLDISMSGAAIDLAGPGTPFVGTRVRVGDRFATGMRLTETGIAVQFTPENFDERVRL